MPVNIPFFGEIDPAKLVEDAIKTAAGGYIAKEIGEMGQQDPKDQGKAVGEAQGEAYEELMEAYRRQQMPQALKDLEVQALLAPLQQRLNYEQLLGSEEAKLLPEGFTPGVKQYQTLDSDLEKMKRQSGAAINLDILREQGPYIAQAIMNQMQLTDKPFLDARERGGQAAVDLLNSINLEGLSGGERAEIERSNALRNLQRQGTTDSGGNLAAIENAMNFGSRLDKKKAQLGSALQAVTNFAAGTRSGVDPLQASVGQTSGANRQTADFQQMTAPKDYTNLAGQGTSLLAGVANQPTDLQNMFSGFDYLKGWSQGQNPWTKS
ncbi:MAG: hypothetical protein CMM02_08610 [Rhodopirellula sp.]|jgi:hypothetical protein|nr:hypothetical protein [Rhodopirellula sp.]